ncbi:MAG: methyltransferase [Mariprofundus sp.]|nr:methyltransferase [Mariprofundus sp.]
MSSELTFGQRLHKILLLARIPASILMGAAILLLARPTLTSWIFGLAVVAVGEALRLWASGHIHKSAEVTVTGPYAMCRHPLYLGHFLVATGFCVTGDSITAFIIVSLAFFIIYMPTWKNEEQNLIQLFGDTYREFMAVTPAMLPRWNGKVFNGSFSWALVKQHREWKHAATLLAGMLIMLMIGLWRGSL